jgi:hypothetical protein
LKKYAQRLNDITTGRHGDLDTSSRKNAHESVFGFHLKFASSSFVSLIIDKNDLKHPIAGFLES